MSKPSPGYKYSFATKRLRRITRALAERIEKFSRNGKEIPEGLLEQLLAYVKELERLEGEPRLSEIQKLRQEIGALAARIGNIEAKDAFGRMR